MLHSSSPMKISLSSGKKRYLGEKKLPLTVFFPFHPTGPINIIFDVGETWLGAGAGGGSKLIIS